MIEQIVRVTETDDGTKAEIIGEIVRCKDCKSAIGYTTAFGLYGGLTCDVIDRDVDDKFYCAYGERKETEDVGIAQMDSCDGAVAGEG